MIRRDPTSRMRPCPRSAALAGLAALLALGAVPVTAQEIDRSTPPVLGPPAELRLPPVRTTRLPNGVTIRVVEMHEVPLVQVTLRIRGGARLDGAQPGLATFTANMLDEGAGARDAFGIAAEAAYLGATLSTAADWDQLYLSLNTPRRTLGEALDLLADVALRPAFRSEDVTRERGLRLAQILQQRDQPRVMATLAFNAIVFPKGHPYHRPLNGDSAATARLDSAAVRGFYRRVVRPDRAEFVITGDISAAEAAAAIARRFGGWRPGSSPALTPPTPPAPKPPAARTVYLVDKPGAAQSVIVIGAPGVPRTAPDYAAIEVMNTILGGSFSSRLNQNLRETKGYTYGAGSGFSYRPLPGPFAARSDVRTDVTDSALVEFFREFAAIRDSLVSPDELARATNYLVLGLPRDFETTGQMAGQIGDLLTFGLPFTWYNSFLGQVMRVDREGVRRAARTRVNPERVAVVVVGDVARIRPGIEALGLGPIVVWRPEDAGR